MVSKTPTTLNPHAPGHLYTNSKRTIYSPRRAPHPHRARQPAAPPRAPRPPRQQRPAPLPRRGRRRPPRRGERGRRSGGGRRRTRRRRWPTRGPTARGRPARAAPRAPCSASTRTSRPGSRSTRSSCWCSRSSSSSASSRCIVGFPFPFPSLPLPSPASLIRSLLPYSYLIALLTPVGTVFSHCQDHSSVLELEGRSKRGRLNEASMRGSGRRNWGWKGCGDRWLGFIDLGLGQAQQDLIQSATRRVRPSQVVGKTNLRLSVRRVGHFAVFSGVQT